jgi:hypothetical protein
MPKREAEFFEVLIGQKAQDGNINIVISKTLGILGHTELFEPIGNLLHRGPPTCGSDLTEFSTTAREFAPISR